MTVRSDGPRRRSWPPPGVTGATVIGVDRIDAARELGVPAAAAPALVEKAFRRAARARHPDVGGDPVAFRRATEARAVLLRPRSPDAMERVVQVIVRYHPAVRLIETLARVIERRSPVP